MSTVANPTTSGFARAEASAAGAFARTAYIDWIRVVLTVQVIFHHAAITYGASGGWYFKEPARHDVTSIFLSMFCTIDQAYFMGFFFLLAGYYTPPSLARKGIAKFVLDRLARLGVPLLVYAFLISPTTEALALMARGRTFTHGFAWMVTHNEFENGPLWFAQALLIFAFAYLLRLWLRNPAKEIATAAATKSSWNAARAHRILAIGIFVVGFGAFLIRQWIPVGENRFGLQWAYFASYIFLFALGCAASHSNALEEIDYAFARPWIRVASVSLPLFFAYAVLAGALHGGEFNSSGGISFPALAYAFWEPLVAWGVILFYLTRFRRHSNTPSANATQFGLLSFGAYIIHPPLLVGGAVLIHDWPLPAAAKFVLLGSVTAFASFGVAGLARRIPGFARVI